LADKYNQRAGSSPILDRADFRDDSPLPKRLIPDILTFSTDIEADKASTTKISAIKTFYDWAVGKFQTITQSTSNLHFAIWNTFNSKTYSNSGEIYSETISKQFIQYLIDKKLLDNVKLIINANGGYVKRTSTIYNYATRVFSFLGGIDLNQSTAANQPQLDRVALTEPLGLKNQNGGVGFMTHSPISFAANEAWTVECVVNSNGVASHNLCGSANTSLRFASNVLYVINESGAVQSSLGSVVSTYGKNTVFTIRHDGSGGLKSYINGALLGSVTGATANVVFNSFMAARGGQFAGTSFHYAIYSKALSDSEILEGASILKSIFPEIPSVQIGTQRWAVRNWDAVTTPQGNTIQEMQAAANVERITNAADREFSSDTGFWVNSSGTPWVISGGVATFTGAGTSVNLQNNSILTAGKWYRVQYTVLNYVQGSVQVVGFDTVIPRSANGTYIEYHKASGALGGFRGITTASLAIDNVSIQEVGFSDSTNLYNAIYAQTSGTVEQKTYAALKAAGMWCHYNNSVEIGSVYGKLYNWYAVKLLQMDIDYYNAANPNNQWGWRVPTEADFTTLQTFLGGASVAGGKMKTPGLTYWNSPNTGATNESGFSALPGGYRLTAGFFVGLNSYGVFYSTDINIDKPYRMYPSSDSNMLSIDVIGDVIHAHSLRLIQQTPPNYLVDGSGNRIIDGSGNYVTQ
jgi:uncharacterized protein (TIGR02145 family)